MFYGNSQQLTLCHRQAINCWSDSFVLFWSHYNRTLANDNNLVQLDKYTRRIIVWQLLVHWFSAEIVYCYGMPGIWFICQATNGHFVWIHVYFISLCRWNEETIFIHDILWRRNDHWTPRCLWRRRWWCRKYNRTKNNKNEFAHRNINGNKTKYEIIDISCS